MTLAERRCRFTQFVGKLLTFADVRGITCAIDEVKRSRAAAAANAATGAGIANSLHTVGLAVDLLIFRKLDDGTWQYLNEGTEPEYRELAVYWKSLDSECAWGGDFSRPDPDHYSLATGGVR